MVNVHQQPSECPPMSAIDVAIEEKTRVAKMASMTLHKLHDAMQRMKEWREDSVQLKSSIWRMKMALQADESEDNPRVDPLIAHQRAQIGRLEQANDELEHQVMSLKRALSKAEGDAVPVSKVSDQMARIEEEFAHERDHLHHEILNLRARLRQTQEDQMNTVALEHRLKDKLLELTRGDRMIEIVLTNAIGRTVETVVGLSEELVYLNEDLCRARTRNRNLHAKLERSRAMLRTRCGGHAEYRKRVDELTNLAAQLLGEMDRLRMSCDSRTNHDDIADIIGHVERLMAELRHSLRSEREALIAAGDPDCLRYMKRVLDLKVNLRVLSVELRRSSVFTWRESNGQQDEQCRWRTVSLLDEFLQRIDAEMESVRVRPIDKYCRIGGVSGARYAAKVTELEGMVKRSMEVIATLKTTAETTTSADEKLTDELADTIERVCGGMKDLEVLDDRPSLRNRIDQLEASVMQLKLQLTARDEHVRALSDEHAAVTSSLQHAREHYDKIIGDMRNESEQLREDMECRKRQISELSRERERSARRADCQVQLMQAEMDAERKKLRDVRNDAETLSRDAERMRATLRTRDRQIADITAERDALKEKLEAELRAKLEAESEAAAKKRSDDDNDESVRQLRDELGQLKAESEEREISLNEATERIGHLRRALDKVISDRARLESEMYELKSNEQSLTQQLNARTSACETVTRESERTAAANETLASEAKQLRDERDRLMQQLSELRSEKGVLARAMADANEAREAVAEGLKFQLERTRERLDDASEEVAQLQAERARIAGDLEAESLRRSGAEERVRALVTEKNELTARVNELNGASVGLQERLAKAETENEYFSIELNKSRLENDRARTKNDLLHVTCDKRERDNCALRRERDEAWGRLNEIGSECRILANQLAIHRMRYEALRSAVLYHQESNNDRKAHLKEIDTRQPVAKPREPALARSVHVKRNLDYSDAARTTELRPADAVIFKIASARDDNKATVKQSTIMDEHQPALTLQLAGLSKSSDEGLDEITEGQPKGQPLDKGPAWPEWPNVDAFRSLLSGREIVNMCCKTDATDYPSESAVIFGDDEKWSAAITIDRLEVENAALRMELDMLRNSLNCSLTDGEKTKLDVGRAAEEIQALKLELIHLRDERSALRSRFEMLKKELKMLRFERVALKDELAACRCCNFDLRRRANDLRTMHDQLKATNAELEKRLRDALSRQGTVRRGIGA